MVASTEIGCPPNCAAVSCLAVECGEGQVAVTPVGECCPACQDCSVSPRLPLWWKMYALKQIRCTSVFPLPPWPLSPSYSLSHAVCVRVLLMSDVCTPTLSAALIARTAG